MNGSILNRAFWIKQKLLRHAIYKEYKKSLRRESLSESQLKELNWKRRVDLVEYAYANSQFYKMHLENAGYKSGDLRNESDWDSIPCLTKADVRDSASCLMVESVNPKHLRKITTGGSTGKPLTSFRDKRFSEEILQWRAIARFEDFVGQNMAMLWRIPKSNQSLAYKLTNSVIWFPTKRLFLDASSIDKTLLSNMVGQIKRYQITILWGYAGALEQLIDYCIDENRLLHSVRLVWSTASPINELITGKFSIACPNAHVMDQYACSEMHWVASNCAHGNQLHVELDHRHLEIVDDDLMPITKPDSYGEILLTDFENRVFPLIKYRVGDRTAWSSTQCECRRSLPTIHKVQGRVSDNLVLQNGITLSGEFLTTLFDTYVELVDRFQIVMRKDQKLVIKIDANSEASIDSLNRMKEEVGQLIRKISNESVVPEFDLMEKDIVHNRGKYKFIIDERVNLAE